ncbi:MAG TPA: metalloregulator ArsR/SmtB family transcription factor [Candidatus Thermoplasmatota archaeon]|nr:metalloregulator ArsR/SmtB family transcription factor [Candidatus Thermoplasmatota archaeon]
MVKEREAVAGAPPREAPSGSAHLDAVFSALSHPIRRAIIERLAEGECTVGDLAAPHNVSLPAISKHLRILEEAGLLEQTPEGRVRRCALKPQPLSAAFSWIVQYRIFWEQRFDRLAAHLEELNKEVKE